MRASVVPRACNRSTPSLFTNELDLLFYCNVHIYEGGLRAWYIIRQGLEGLYNYHSATKSVIRCGKADLWG